MYDLEAGKIKVSRSVKLDEREVDGIYDTQVIEPNTVIQVTKDVDENNIQQSKTDQPILDEPMEAVEDNVADIEMDNVNDTPSIAVRQLPAPERPVYNRLELAEFRPQQEQQENRLVFRPGMERRRRCKPMLMLGDGQEDEELKEESDSPPTPKRARIDEDDLIAEAVIAYAVSMDEDTELPTTYAQAMASDEAPKWREAMDAELHSHEQNKT